MMARKEIICFCLLALVVITTGISANAAESSFLRGLASSSDLDGEIIEVTGEAIGEVIKGDKGFWINIKSDDMNIGIFSPQPKEFNKIKYWGSYGQVGDTVKIRGTFYKNCPQHQISDIHLDELVVINKGHKVETPVSPKKVRLAVVLFAIFVFTAIVYFVKGKYGTRA